jgi:hypothetical protein
VLRAALALRLALTLAGTVALATESLAVAAPLLELPGRVRVEPPLGLVPESVRPPLLYKARRGAGPTLLTVTIESLSAPRDAPAALDAVDNGVRVAVRRRTVTPRPGQMLEIVATSPNAAEAAAAVDAIAASVQVADGPERTARTVEVAGRASGTGRTVRTGRASWPMPLLLVAIGIVLAGLGGFVVKRMIR